LVTIAFAVIYAFAFLFGICIGSFLNVLIYRVPLGINVAKGRSFCPQCHNTLTARDLVPLVSFGLLGGHCRFCGAKISWRYPLVEALGGMLGLLSVAFWFVSWQALLVFAVTCVLLTISFIDWDTQEIPDVLNIVLMGLAITAIFVFRDVSLLSRVIGFFEIPVLMIVVNLIKKGSFGGGDIKMCAAAGFLLGWQNMLVAAFIGIITGGIYGVYLLASRKKSRKEHFAFGPFLAVGITVSLYMGSLIWQAYLGLFSI